LRPCGCSCPCPCPCPLLGALFVDAGGLALAPAQVVQLGAAHVAPPFDLDAVDDRGVEREDALESEWNLNRI